MKLTEKTECFAIPGRNAIIDVINPETGRSVHGGKTLDEYRAEPGNIGARVMTLGEYAEDKAKRQRTPIKWTATTAERFEEMLCCLPPADMYKGGFLVGEPTDHEADTGHPRFQAFRDRNGKFETSSRPLTVEEFRAAVDVEPERWPLEYGPDGRTPPNALAGLRNQVRMIRRQADAGNMKEVELQLEALLDDLRQTGVRFEWNGGAWNGGADNEHLKAGVAAYCIENPAMVD